jgi:hypothetical protein
MHVYMYMYIYVYIYVCICICIYTYMLRPNQTTHSILTKQSLHKIAS